MKINRAGALRGVGSKIILVTFYLLLNSCYEAASQGDGLKTLRVVLRATDYDVEANYSACTVFVGGQRIQIDQSGAGYFSTEQLMGAGSLPLSVHGFNSPDQSIKRPIAIRFVQRPVQSGGKWILFTDTQVRMGQEAIRADWWSPLPPAPQFEVWIEGAFLGTFKKKVSGHIIAGSSAIPWEKVNLKFGEQLLKISAQGEIAPFEVSVPGTYKVRLEAPYHPLAKLSAFSTYITDGFAAFEVFNADAVGIATIPLKGSLWGKADGTEVYSPYFHASVSGASEGAVTPPIARLGAGEPSSPFAEPEPIAIRVVSVTGKTTSSRSGATPERVLRPGDVVTTKDLVYADANSTVVLMTSDGRTITVADTTVVEFAILKDGNGAGRLFMNARTGQITVKQLPRGRFLPELEIATPHASVKDKETEYIVKIGWNFTIVSVAEGKVQVKPNNPALKSVVVGAGRQVEVKADTISKLRRYSPNAARYLRYAGVLAVVLVVLYLYGRVVERRKQGGAQPLPPIRA